MATPIIHASAGILITSLYFLRVKDRDPILLYRLTMAGIIFACLPDIDLLYSYLLTGSVIALHFGITHTILFAIMVALMVRLLSGGSILKRTLLIFMLIFSHVIIDGLTGPERGFTESVGIKALAPFFNWALVSPFTLFKGVVHAEWFGYENMKTVLIDMLFFVFAFGFFLYARNNSINNNC